MTVGPLCKEVVLLFCGSKVVVPNEFLNYQLSNIVYFFIFLFLDSFNATVIRVSHQLEHITHGSGCDGPGSGEASLEF